MLISENKIVSDKILVFLIYYIVPLIENSGYNYPILSRKQRVSLIKQNGRLYFLKVGDHDSPFVDLNGYFDYLIIDNVSKYQYYKYP